MTRCAMAAPEMATASPAEAAQARPAPELSVLIPFFRDDPMPLVRALVAQAGPADAVEIVLFDDGTGDAGLSRGIRREIRRSPIPVRLVTARSNRGRAAARNRLAAAARGAWLLFLDSGMHVGPGFVSRHLEAARSDSFDAAFGGYRFEAAPDADLALHAALAAASEVQPAAERARSGPIAFCTGNLLMRRDVAQTVPFDEDYSGWGWEDVDWAVRADRKFRLAHFDNPTGRLPSDTPAELLAKYQAAAPNLARLLDRFPELARMRGARTASAMRRLPGQRLVRGLWAQAVQSTFLPLRLRVLALKLWRASWAAEALRR